ncbi:hypothetical protein [Flavobacterium pedocola]
MKTITFKTAVLVILMTVSLASNSNTIVSDSTKINSTSKIEDDRALVLVNRLEEIRAMKKSDLTRLEKKELRKEVKEIKKEMRNSNSGIYLSVGAIIIVILLLILLL